MCCCYGELLFIYFDKKEKEDEQCSCQDGRSDMTQQLD